MVGFWDEFAFFFEVDVEVEAGVVDCFFWEVEEVAFGEEEGGEGWAELDVGGLGEAEVVF